MGADHFHFTSECLTLVRSYVINGASTMGGYLLGWRRKLGLATLFISCLLAAQWARSYCWRDFLRAPYETSHWTASIESDTGFLEFRIDENFKHQHICRYSTSDAGWNSDRSPFEFECDAWVQDDQYCFRTFVHYWSLVLPLTALSAYLLLSKPRQTPSAPPEDVHQ